MPVAAIVVAAGAGVRMGAGVPKALMPLAGRPMVAWTLEALAAAGRIDHVVVAAPPGMEDQVRAAVGRDGLAVVPGGASRAESVREALAAVPAAAGRVLVHDAARPLMAPELVGAVLDALEHADGAIAAAPVVDTLKLADDAGAIARTVPREGLWGAQTPQAFHTATLRAAVAAADAAGRLALATDCASLLEGSGATVRLVPSTAPNPKVTTPADRALAEAMLAARGGG
ncbi:2-C-methyl-D-erythritol 4-phosphate cytidylyltransferase [Miltoncostaea marina]|uniref:2-C-methyl-D-erythritol 4-phosphate cytidylyltransferase n=1 Tax=Miltoncostaea marina TaxID=2843215 RepID=UPI001C3CBE56|nr:2-C-methyl-D-erythritol 4-phosphate cytidylyltransferase [Miltoncostaea marina]